MARWRADERCCDSSGWLCTGQRHTAAASGPCLWQQGRDGCLSSVRQSRCRSRSRGGAMALLMKPWAAALSAPAAASCQLGGWLRGAFEPAAACCQLFLQRLPPRPRSSGAGDCEARPCSGCRHGLGLVLMLSSFFSLPSPCRTSSHSIILCFLPCSIPDFD